LPISTFKPLDHLKSPESLGNFANELFKEVKHRSDGLRIILGAEVVERLAQTRLFMVGAGAIGCELLKNFAMLGVGTGKPQGKNKQGGQIVLTDPDVIEVSNLNRQFLFREKHLRKPKSSTAAAAAIYMNRELKENIVARLDKVHEGTANIFTD
jgi:molybdopterin/thiamine biosynthesis adenylyltransferase